MQNDKKNDSAPSLVQKMGMWLTLRKMIKITKRSINHAHLTIHLYQSLAQRAGESGRDSAKKEKNDIDMKTSQMEASLLSEQRSLEVLQEVDLDDPALYQAIED